MRAPRRAPSFPALSAVAGLTVQLAPIDRT